VKASKQRAVFEQVFGGRLSSRQVHYFNPADETLQIHRNVEYAWAIDVIAQPPAVVEFEADDEEDTGAYKAEMEKLQKMLKAAAVEVDPTKELVGK